MEEPRGGASPFRGIKTPPHSPRVDEVRPCSRTHRPLSRSSSDKVRAEARQLLAERQLTLHDKVGEFVQRLEAPTGRTGRLLDSQPQLERAFTALLDNRLLTCERAVADDVDSEILGFTLQRGCDSGTVADVAAALEKTQPRLALLLWAAWAMNETSADGEFVAAITTVLELKQRIEMPSRSLSKILSQLSTHVLALLELGRASEAEQVLVSDPLHDCNLLEGGELREAVETRSDEVRELIRTELGNQEWRGLRSAAIESLAAWGVSLWDSWTVVADGDALDALVRLFSLQSLGSRVKQWVGDDEHGFLGFSLWQLGTSHDVLTVAAAFKRADRSGLALLLLAAHLTQLHVLAEDDLPCVALAIEIASTTDLPNGLAMRAVRSILLHGRLLRQCDLFAGPPCDTALEGLEKCLTESVLAGTGGTRDMLPIGTIDGVCHLLDGLTGRRRPDEQRQKIVQAAARLAAVDSGPGRRRIERSLKRAAAFIGKWADLPDEKRFAALCEEHRMRVIAQLRVLLKRQHIQWKKGKFVAPDDKAFSWSPLSCMSAVAIAHVRLCRPGPGRHSAASEASTLIKLLHPQTDVSDIALRAALLALGLRCSAAGLGVKDETLGSVLDELLADDKVREAMLEGDVSDLPVVMCTLLQASWFTTDARKTGFDHIVDSAAFAAVMAGGSAPRLLDEALGLIGANPMLLPAWTTRHLLRRMITPRACRGSLKALVRPTLLKTINDRSRWWGPVLIEALLLLDHDVRKPLVDAVMKLAFLKVDLGSHPKVLTAALNHDARKLVDAVMKLALVNVDLGDHQKALTAVLSHPISATWSLWWGPIPPGFVLARPSLLSIWLGTGLADACESGKLLENLAADLREQHECQSSEWRDSAAELVFAVRVALRASEGFADDVLDAIVSPPLTRGSREYGRSELFAHASLLACQWVLKGRALPIPDTAQVALLARLMCAALALDMDDPASYLDHLAWVDHLVWVEAGKVEQGPLDAKWFSDLRAELAAMAWSLLKGQGKGAEKEAG